jgi:hypothetical protein
MPSNGRPLEEEDGVEKYEDTGVSKFFPIAALFTTNPAWIILGYSPGLLTKPTY